MTNHSNYTPALGRHSLTDYYDRLISITMPEKRFRKALVNHISSKSNQKILEFGFGTAQNLINVIEDNNQAEYYGLDIDKNVKSLADRKLKKLGLSNIVNLSIYDGSKLPYEDNYFDTVYSCLVFHHLDNAMKKRAFSEIYRVLKSSGKILICDWGKPQNNFLRMMFYSVQILDGFNTTSENVNGHLPLLIDDANFKNRKVIQRLNANLGTLDYISAYK